MMDRLPPNPLQALTDEIARILPSLLSEHPAGPSLREVAAAIAADYASVRAAAGALNAAGRADLMRQRRSRELFLVPPKYRKADGLAHCANCGEPFDRGPKVEDEHGTRYNDRRTCSRSCAVSLAWKKPGGKERRRASLSAAQSTPEALERTARSNEKRWSRPGERERLAERNKRMWSDPAKKAVLVQKIKAVNGTPEKRQFYSELRKAHWADPENRAKMVEPMRQAHRTAEAKAASGERMRARWRDPEQRNKLLAATKRNMEKAMESIRGRPQAPETVRARVGSTLATKKAKAEQRG